MLQLLPLEVLTHIASFIPLEDTSEFGSACQKCYFAVLPHIWHHLSINNTKELNLVASRLKSNSVWADRAIHFVRDVSLEPCSHPKISSTLAAAMFGIASTPSDQEKERKEYLSITPHERIGAFGKRLLQVFPHLSNLVFDFSQAVKNFYMAPPPNTKEDTNEDTIRLPFSGSVSLVNYKSDNTKLMHYLLAPFRRTHHLKVQALPVVSLCDDIDESILTDNDIADLATLGLTHLRQLELSYLDSDIHLETMKSLVMSLPHLTDLTLEWIFPPNKHDYLKLCEMLENYGSLHPETVENENNIMLVHFAIDKNPVIDHGEH
ncbi:MAG: hypothetical protein EXX96DRAFT_575539 [Benjaminiella poitrasii]|nr:MAG: hypothetical protein EXX96DRAFT_575539 [Benjaminiella poitrasii]